MKNNNEPGRQLEAFSWGELLGSLLLVQRDSLNHLLADFLEDSIWDSLAGPLQHSLVIKAKEALDEK